MAKTLFERDYSDYPGAEIYPRLFKPIEIGNLMVPDPIKYAATEDKPCGHYGFVTDEKSNIYTQGALAIFESVDMAIPVRPENRRVK